MDCGTIENAADAERWVKARAARDKVPSIRRRRARSSSATGLDIVRLRSGLERVALYAMGQPTITPDDVKQVVAAGPEAHATSGSRTRSSATTCGGARELGARSRPAWSRSSSSASCGLPRSGCRHGGCSRPSTPCSGRTSRSSPRAETEDPARAAGGGVVREQASLNSVARLRRDRPAS